MLQPPSLIPTRDFLWGSSRVTDGQCRIFPAFLCNEALVEFEVCLGSLSCWKVQRRPSFSSFLTVGMTFYPKTSRDFNESTLAGFPRFVKKLLTNQLLHESGKPGPCLWRTFGPLFWYFLHAVKRDNKPLASSGISCVPAQAHLVQRMKPLISCIRFAWDKTCFA